MPNEDTFTADDLFGWTIGMPFLCRLSCIKSNIIYVIYILQKSRIIRRISNQFSEGNTRQQSKTAAYSAASKQRQ